MRKEVVFFFESQLNKNDNMIRNDQPAFTKIILFVVLITLTQCDTPQDLPQNNPSGEIIFTQNAIDRSANDLECYKIETPTAIYFLEKAGLGLSSLTDRDGNDWISFSPLKGTKSEGEYRGFPNAIFRQEGNYFHPLNSQTDISTSEIVYEDKDKVSITGKSGNGQWECRWDFYLTHCTFTMTKMPDINNYWILYEGTPGGSIEDSDWWMTSETSNKNPLTVSHQGDIQDPEWIVFGDSLLTRSLFIVNQNPDRSPDIFYLQDKKMTVSGFGRKGLNAYLNSVPNSFSIGILETDDHNEISEKIRKLF